MSGPMLGWPQPTLTQAQAPDGVGILTGPLPTGYTRLGGVPPVSVPQTLAAKPWAPAVALPGTGITATWVSPSGYAYRCAGGTTLYWSLKGGAWSTTTAPATLGATDTWEARTWGGQGSGRAATSYPKVFSGDPVTLSDGRFAFCKAGNLYVFTPGSGWITLAVAAIGANDAMVIPYGTGKAIIDAGTNGVALFDGAAIQATSRTGTTWGYNNNYGPALGRDGLLYFFAWSVVTATPTLSYATFNPATGTFSPWSNVAKTGGALTGSVGAFGGYNNPASTYGFQMGDGRWIFAYQDSNQYRWALVLDTVGGTLTSPLGLGRMPGVGTSNPGFLAPSGLVTILAFSAGGTNQPSAVSLDPSGGSLKVVAACALWDGTDYASGYTGGGILAAQMNSAGLIYVVGSVTDGASATSYLGRWWDPTMGFLPGVDVLPNWTGTTNHMLPLRDGLILLTRCNTATYRVTLQVLAPEGSVFSIPVPPRMGGYYVSAPVGGGLYIETAYGPVVSCYLDNPVRLLDGFTYYAVRSK